MPRSYSIFSAVAFGLVLLAVLNAAADELPENFDAPQVLIVPPPQRPTLNFTLGGGASLGPSYFGSDEYSVLPRLPVNFTFLRIGSMEYGSTDPDAINSGFGLRGMFLYIPERSASDHPELTGLNDIDATLLLGLGLEYTTPNFETFADVGYGVIGTNAFVGRVGADWVTRPSDALTLRIGPRLFLMSDKFANDYYGVTVAESAPSGLAVYDPSGGLMSAGLQFRASYMLNDSWGLDSAVIWDRLMSDAADNPITALGRDDQFTFQIALTRRFTWEF